MDPKQRKNTRPDIDREDVVIGFTKAGICELHDVVNINPTSFKYKTSEALSTILPEGKHLQKRSSLVNDSIAQTDDSVNISDENSTENSSENSSDIRYSIDETPDTEDVVMIDPASGTARLSVDDIPKTEQEIDDAVNRLVAKLGVDESRAPQGRPPSHNHRQEQRLQAGHAGLFQHLPQAISRAPA